MARNSQKRIYLENGVYFITTKTKNNYPYFGEPNLAKLCMAKIFLAQEWMQFILYGFVIMPDHLHIMLMPNSEHNISQIMHNIKRNTSRSANILITHQTHVGEDDHPRPREKKCFEWFFSFHDHIIRGDDDFLAHLAYIRLNPVKHGAARADKPFQFIYFNQRAISRLLS